MKSLYVQKIPLWLQKSLLVILFCWMAVYPIYKSYYYANGVDHYERHQSHIKGESMFFNPWQYRVLCPLIIEGLYWVADHTAFQIIEIKGINLGVPGDMSGKNASTQQLINSLKNPEFVKYTIVFLAFRFAQNILLLWLCYKYFLSFTNSRKLILFMLMVATLFMGNGVVDSDLTFNTYMDLIVYVAAAIVIVRKLNPLWIIPITLIGALNRETSLMIPVLYFFVNFKWSAWPKIPALITDNLRVVSITTVSVISFAVIFIAIRMYYGIQPVSSWRVAPGLPMLKLNLFSSVSIKSYMELFGVMGFLPLWVLLFFKQLSPTLRILFLTLVPAWFAIHLTSGIAYQSRLFLVPVLVVILPAMLEYFSDTSQYSKTAKEPSGWF